MCVSSSVLQVMLGARETKEVKERTAWESKEAQEHEVHQVISSLSY